jgi:hypothetical protein
MTLSRLYEANGHSNSYSGWCTLRTNDYEPIGADFNTARASVFLQSETESGNQRPKHPNDSVFWLKQLIIPNVEMLCQEGELINDSMNEAIQYRSYWSAYGFVTNEAAVVKFEESETEYGHIILNIKLLEDDTTSSFWYNAIDWEQQNTEVVQASLTSLKICKRLKDWNVRDRFKEIEKSPGLHNPSICKPLHGGKHLRS